MGFDEKDTTAERTVSRKVEGVTFRRQVPAAAVEAVEVVLDEEGEIVTHPIAAVAEVPPIAVTVEIIEDGASVIKRIPDETVVADWPGKKKTLKAHLLAIADVALGLD